LSTCAGSTAASFILLEMRGAFTAAIAVEDGRIVDGIGGTSEPLGVAAGALDGEVAFLAGSITKGLLFVGGAATIAGAPEASPRRSRPRARSAVALPGRRTSRAQRRPWRP
jgi:predicted butyrate kinase (DUF1464 family)